MSEKEFTWPDSDVAWHGIFDSDRLFAIEHGVHVFVMNDLDALHRAVQTDKVAAMSRTYDEEDVEGVQATIWFAPPIALSTVVHEVTHVALLWHRDDVTPHQRAKAWLHNHPESIAELIGNLSSVLWNSMPAEYCEL